MRKGEFLKDAPLHFALVVNTVETDDPLKEYVELWVAARVFSHLEQRLEDVDNDLLEVVHEASGLVHIVQTRDLDEPPHVRREKLIVDDPSSQLVPFLQVATIDGDAPFYELILA